MPYLWLVFVGGTGTGKSTLFNAFCGMPLSETGVERPKTCGPIVFAHRDCPIEKGFPFSSIQIERQPSEDFSPEAASGQPGHILILEHDRKEWAHLVVVDTPDLDSIEAVNRQIAQDLYLLSDAAIFVTSQEKYADEIPFQLLQRVSHEKKPYFFILNKAQSEFAIEEVTTTLESQGISLRKELMWSIPFAPSNPFQWISEHAIFRDFINHLSGEFSAENIDEFREKQHLKRGADLKLQVGRLIELMEKEELAAQQWLDQLDTLYQKVSQELIKEQKERFTAESRGYLQTEIRKLFTKYDVLAKPRRFVKELLLTPFRLLGFRSKGGQELQKQGLLKVREKIDLTPVQMSILKFNRLVLEKLSPSEKTSPLFTKLREPGVLMNDKEIKRRVWEEQDQMAAWLEETFNKLSQGIPKTKEWGIYSTSILWGILILSFETVAGGGFTVLDAALDTAIAPFVTKGAVELFAYHEIQKVAKELAKRYQEGLVSVVRQQRDRYEHCIKAQITPLEDLEALRGLLK
jgi:GTPase SAR1 family protein